MTEELMDRIQRLEKRNKTSSSFLVVAVIILFLLVAYLYIKHAELLTAHTDLTVHSIKANTVVAGSVDVVGPHGKNSVSFGATDDGWSVLSFRDTNGDQKAALLLTPSGKPSLSFFRDKTARLTLGRVDAPNGQGEEFSLLLKDSNNNVIWHPDAVNPY